ncbi:MAG: nicotinamide-nucleotide amidohydrolase family protein [Firmicutes bacterium]|nr:nicotinamide-nucleotide amidohydrolase family protein [Bacillota bacterium]
MNTTIITILEDFALSTKADEVSDFVSLRLFYKNFSVTNKVQTINSKEAVSTSISNAIKNSDCVFVIADVSLTNHLKELDALCKNIYEQKSVVGETSCTIVVLPLNSQSAASILREKVFPHFKQNHNFSYTTEVFKAFGLTKQDALEAIKGLNRNRKDLRVTLLESFHEIAIVITYSDKVSDKVLANLIQQIFDRLSQFIYADQDTLLAQRAHALLEVKGKKLAVAESFTGGAVASALVSVPGSGEVFLQGHVTYCPQSKVRVLGVSPKTIDEYGTASVPVALEMARGLLDITEADIVIATTGVAGPAKDSFGAPVGLCFIAVGDRQSINVYEHNFEGSRDDIRLFGTKYALGLIIRKIREDDFQLSCS